MRRISEDIKYRVFIALPIRNNEEAATRLHNVPVIDFDYDTLPT